MSQNWEPPIPPEDAPEDSPENKPEDNPEDTLQQYEQQYLQQQQLQQQLYQQQQQPPQPPQSPWGTPIPPPGSQQNILQQYEQQYQQYQQQYQQGGYAVGPVHYSWQEAFQMAVFNPAPETYERLAADPEGGFNRAVKWIAVAYAILFALAFVLVFCFLGATASSTTTSGSSSGLAGAFGGSVICLAIAFPIAVVIAIVAGIIGIGLIHIPALIFGGEGDFDSLYYVMVALYLPLTVAASLIGIIPILGTLINIVIYLYMSVLMVFAVKGVHKISWLGAVVSVYWVYVFVFLCYAFYFASIIGSTSSISTQ